MATLEEIENNNRVEKSRRKIAGFPDKRWMGEIDWLIAEVKRLREENTALRNDKERIEFENNQFRRYVIETGCSYTQTESDCECDYGYPWPCDHCPIVEHNRTIDAEMEAEK